MNDNDNKVLDLIAQDKSYADYFFRKAKGGKWFFLLKGRGYFNPSAIEKDEKTNFTSFWNVLDYLERVSEYVTDDKYQEYGKELLLIIDNVVQHSRQERKLNNYHIWWYFVKILIKLPRNLIIENVTVDQFKLWLSEWTDPSLAGDLVLHNIAEDLLGRFLDDQATIIYAEAIIENITRIREPEKKKKEYSIFSDREDAKLAWSSYWLLDGFRKNHIKIGERCSMKVILDLANKLKRALEYRQQDNYVNFDVGDNVYQLKISRVKQDNLSVGEIGFKDGVYDCFISQYAQEQLKDLDRQKDFWALHKVEPQIKIVRFQLNAIKTLEEFLLAFEEELPKQISWDQAEDYEQKKINLFEGLFEDYGHIWFRTLADSGSTHADNAQQVLTIILKDVLLSKCASNQEDGQQILKELMTSKYPFPIFTRYCLLCIDHYWDNFRQLFSDLIDARDDLIQNTEFEIELYDLLRNHNEDFDEILNGRIAQEINNVPDYYIKEGPKFVAYWKYCRLSPLKDNVFFVKQYEEEKRKSELNEGEEYKPRRSTIQTGWARHTSPLSPEEIISMKTEDLISFLKEFEGADFWRGSFEGKPDKEGLKDNLQQVARENPERFTSDFEQFIQQGLYRYIHGILWGIRDAWRDGKPLQWDKVLNFCLAYIKQSWFMDDAMKDQGEDSGKYKGKYLWIVDAVVDLIEGGSRDDTRAFGKEYFPIAEEIFDVVLSLAKGEKQPNTQRDAVTYAINTTLGKIIESYIIFSLRVARIKQKEGEEQEKDWGNKRYERFFVKGIEAYIFLGRYLPNLRFLDNGWADQKIKEMSERPVSDFEWKNFMEAYLTGPHLYKDTYELLRPDYRKAIEQKVFEENVDRRLVEHITIAYLRGYDNLTEGWNPDNISGLFETLLYCSLSPEKEDRWPEVVSFMWSITGKREEKKKEKDLPEEFIQRMLSFWKWTYDHKENLENKLSDKYPSLVCNLAELTIILDKVDEEKEEWLSLSAPHVERHHFASFFIEYMTLFRDAESIKRIGRIFLKVMEYNTPTFKQEDIVEIVERLFDGDQEDKENARAICNTYGKRGVHFLKDLYYTHQ